MNHTKGGYKVLFLSKSQDKRKKGVAIVTAQLLFHIDPNVDPTQEIKEFVNILIDKSELIVTAYGRTSGDEVAKLILKEGLDTEEVKSRILRYKSRKNLTDNKNSADLKSALSDYLSNYCYKSKTYDGLVDQIQFFPKIVYKNLGLGFAIDDENVIDIMETLTEEEKASLLQNVNARIAKKDREYRVGEELEKYLNDAGLKYGIDCTVDDFVCVNKNYFGIKVYIGERGILDWFDGTFEELKATLWNELKLEAENKVTCPFCGKKIVRYVAMHKLKNCDCGATIQIIDYSLTRGNIIHMKKDIAFMKLDGA
jgi:ribosomal protein L37AE/L43A